MTKEKLTGTYSNILEIYLTPQGQKIKNEVFAIAKIPVDSTPPPKSPDTKKKKRADNNKTSSAQGTTEQEEISSVDTGGAYFSELEEELDEMNNKEELDEINNKEDLQKLGMKIVNRYKELITSPMNKERLANRNLYPE